MKVLVTYDGSPDAKAALAYGIRKVKASGGELIVLRILRRNIFRDDDGGMSSSEETLQDSLPRFENKDTLMHESGNGVRTSIVFTVINTLPDILQNASKVGADLIVAPPEFEQLMVKACCLVDIVADRRGNFGMYKKVGKGQQDAFR